MYKKPSQYMRMGRDSPKKKTKKEKYRHSRWPIVELYRRSQERVCACNGQCIIHMLASMMLNQKGLCKVSKKINI